MSDALVLFSIAGAGFLLLAHKRRDQDFGSSSRTSLGGSDARATTGASRRTGPAARPIPRPLSRQTRGEDEATNRTQGRFQRGTYGVLGRSMDRVRGSVLD